MRGTTWSLPARTLLKLASTSRWLHLQQKQQQQETTQPHRTAPGPAFSFGRPADVVNSIWATFISNPRSSKYGDEVRARAI
ncbi:hypothetical protein ZHAS_00008487 [Anopheles sinensis]|uniref:Uncharacterized protein n=1 Tax=Anopheles sinensis TaxID=74873 RepID=A0A084VSJ9_ANOSI|nr:hypothetical protein ZHAS_00008487 [Anopheles sinensis]